MTWTGKMIKEGGWTVEAYRAGDWGLLRVRQERVRQERVGTKLRPQDPGIE